jgi:hypothetical protein
VPFPAGGELSHLAFLYHGADEYLEHVLAFARAGLAGSEPVFVALPDGLGRRVQAAAGATAWQLAVADMNELGRNPARITLGLGTFAGRHAGQRIRIITEPLAGRKRPPPDAPRQGLWVVNHVSDLVETRSGPAGTTTRLHFRLPGGAPGASGR